MRYLTKANVGIGREITRYFIVSARLFKLYFWKSLNFSTAFYDNEHKCEPRTPVHALHPESNFDGYVIREWRTACREGLEYIIIPQCSRYETSKLWSFLTKVAIWQTFSWFCLTVIGCHWQKLHLFFPPLDLLQRFQVYTRRNPPLFLMTRELLRSRSLVSSLKTLRDRPKLGQIGNRSLLWKPLRQKRNYLNWVVFFGTARDKTKLTTEKRAILTKDLLARRSIHQTAN